MSGSGPAALGGEVHVEVNASEDALLPVDLGSKDKSDDAADRSGSDKDDKRSEREEEDEGGSRGGDEDEGYSPESLHRNLRSARQGEKRAKTRSAKIEKQMVKLSVEMDGLKELAVRGMESTARERKAEAERKYQDAWNRRTKAFDEGKSDDWNKAEADLKSAERDFAEADTQLRTVAAEAANQKKTGTTSVLNDWLEENEWFDPDGKDEKSETARKLSRQIKADGIPPNSVEHFNELNRRLKKAGVKTNQREERDDDQEDEERPQRKNAGDDDRGPRSVVGGRRDEGGQVTDWSKNTKVPRELVRNYQAAGFDTNDPKVKERIVKKYNEYAASRNGGLINVG